MTGEFQLNGVPAGTYTNIDAWSCVRKSANHH
jgi:hypothetical protein